MNSSRPYLVRALLEWIVDNGLTPYMALACDLEGVQVPRDRVSEGRIVLNVSDDATRDFVIDNDEVGFDSRFAGVSQRIRAPIGAVIAVYAKENGRGMSFEPESSGTDATPPEDKPNLRVVKG